MGIGDLLFTFTLLLNNQIKIPIIFNLSYFDNTLLEKNNHQVWYNNPINSLEFRLKLIDGIMQCNDISMKNIVFLFDESVLGLNQHINEIRQLEMYNLKLNLSYPHIKQELSKHDYIIFHTKCRFQSDYNYDDFKLQLKNQLVNFRTDKIVVLLGEKCMSKTFESSYHRISTIYEELLILKRNNTVIDMTVENIHDNLIYENYIKDINIIQNAFKNVLFGLGGQVSTCINFSIQNTIFYCDLPILNEILNPNIFKNHVYFTNLTKFFQNINQNKINIIGNLNSFYLIMQGDGNLVIYDKYQIPKWHSKTWKTTLSQYDLIMQTDGNLVIYDINNNPVWSTDTHNKGVDPKRLDFDSKNGVLRIIDSLNNVVYSSE